MFVVQRYPYRRRCPDIYRLNFLCKVRLRALNQEESGGKRGKSAFRYAIFPGQKSALGTRKHTIKL